VQIGRPCIAKLGHQAGGAGPAHSPALGGHERNVGPIRPERGALPGQEDGAQRSGRRLRRPCGDLEETLGLQGTHELPLRLFVRDMGIIGSGFVQ
jgi:hypothetical protein